eukprot:959180-Prymnesium_polylepis.1
MDGAGVPVGAAVTRCRPAIDAARSTAAIALARPACWIMAAPACPCIWLARRSVLGAALPSTVLSLSKARSSTSANISPLCVRESCRAGCSSCDPNAKIA